MHSPMVSLAAANSAVAAERSSVLLSVLLLPIVLLLQMR